jgi:choline dehydrogenase-like flavoprotein
LAIGGLSNVWGAAVATFDAHDTRGWPIGPADLREHYAATAKRIGISGTNGDDMAEFFGSDMALLPPLDVSGSALELLMAYRRQGRSQLAIGLSRSAVLSEEKGGRLACTLDKGCMWGCPRGAIYNSAYEISALRRSANFRLIPGILVEQIRSVASGLEVSCRELSTGRRFAMRPPRALLAAGVFASARLALDALGAHGETFPVVHSPTAAFGLLLPARIGGRVEERGYGLAQLAFRNSYGATNARIFGLLYDPDAMPIADLTAQSLLSRPGAISIVRHLMPALLVGLVYFPGSFSSSRLKLERDGSCVVTGAVTEEFKSVYRRGVAELRREFRRLGAWMIPGSTKLFPPGAEVHCAGVLPMGDRTTLTGEVVGVAGLHVVDGTILPSMPAKSHTLTVMANAHRIGTLLASAA